MRTNHRTTQKSLVGSTGLMPRTKLLGVAVTIPWLLDTVASPDVSLPEAFLQMGTNVLSWWVVGFHLWFVRDAEYLWRLAG